MPDARSGTGEGGVHQQNTLRLVLTALLTVISVSALFAFLALCYRSHWKAGVLRALPEDPQTVLQERRSPGFRAPIQLAIEVQHPDGSVGYVRPLPNKTDSNSSILPTAVPTPLSTR